ncbi:MAG: NFACT RNA binding domain-containing protein [Candidatus Poribacteria bacterium]|nr:NFACT RNA binding domain-containing protein [Candidatus Poribacteria bacterium]
MSFDSLTLHHVTDEMSHILIGGKIRHIEQANPSTFNIKIDQDKQTHWLTISAHSVHARTHLIYKPSSGQKQSYFADFLSTHLKHGKIIGIEQIGWDRILKITIQPVSDEPVQSHPKTIIIECMGRHSNIILIDDTDSRILECWKHIDETMSRYREVLPGETYDLPPQQEKIDPSALDKITFTELFHSETTWKSLFSKIDGLSPMIAKEIIARSSKSGLWEAYQQVIAFFDTKNVVPQILMDGDVPLAVSPMPLKQFPDPVSHAFDTMSEALAVYYDAITLKENIASEKHRLKQALDKQKKLHNRKEKGLQKDLERAEKSEDYRIYGELILANLHNITRGQKQVELQNYYSPELDTLTISLNPELSPSNNAQSYFKKYTKAKRGFSQIQQLIAALEAEQKVLIQYEMKLESSNTLESLQKLSAEFVENGYLKTQHKNKKQQDISEGPFRKYISKNGFHMYVGRNSESNDLLLRQIAKPRDMWLHAKQIHGSHVIIRNPENKPDIPMPTLLQAAQLAAYFSKAHHSSYVPVDYTWAKYVVKRKGNVAGYVHYTHEKTLYVDPAVPSTNKAIAQ